MTTQTKTSPQEAEVKQSGWWGIPEDRQAEILAQLPEQDQWSFVVTRVSDSAWSLDLPAADTYGELLVGGTNVALDEHYEDQTGVDAKDGDKMLLVCSIKPLEHTATVLEKLRDDKLWPGSAFYQEAIWGTECFICPFSTILWGHSPQTIYLHLTAVFEDPSW